MEVLFKLINNIKNLDKGQLFFVLFSENINQKLIIQLNQDNQLQFGILADDGLLPFYSVSTEVSSGGRKKTSQRWTLFDTGEFYDSFDIVKVTPEFAELYADSMKNDVDLADYGAILGLNEESFAILRDKLIPQIQQIILNEILAVD
jgi:hypothetical protein